VNTVIDTITVKQLAELAMQVELNDNIDFGMLPVMEQESYEMIAASTLNMLHGKSLAEQIAILLASVTHLTVENFVLNATINQSDQ
jgi:hypothetical protein|tara:strand:+ start:276 stop:533 length:258 start_codon:yes stop_codon:yes gene_type:complete